MIAIKDGPIALPRLRDAAVMVESQDGATILRSPYQVPDAPRQFGCHLRRWAKECPDRLCIAERIDGAWQGVNYAQTRILVDTLSSALLGLAPDLDRPLAIVAANSVRYALLKFAAMQVGLAVLPISTNYALPGASTERLASILQRMRPCAIAIDQTAIRGSMIAAILRDTPMITLDDGASVDMTCHRWTELANAPTHPDFEAAFDVVGPGTLAKILLTSGSTGEPKGVVITQATMAANGAGVDALWQFLGDKSPIIVDWLPWSHTFATNFNLGLVMRHGGTLYIDEGRPAPSLVGATVANLADIAPTILVNVPRGFAMLLDALEDDAAARQRIFSRLDAIFYAGAGLPQSDWDRIEAMAIAERGARLPILSSLGSTEVGPVATLSHWGSDHTGSVGLPIPGSEIKLLSNDDKIEMRVRGASVSPGYFDNPDATAAAFDDEGYFILGDAVKFDAEEPESGLIFDGRLAENFKLSSGTWVHVGNLRLALIDALTPLAREIVVAGHGRDRIGILVVPAEPLPADAMTLMATAIEEFNARQRGSSSFVARAAFLAAPLSADAGEITDKGYVNQRKTLTLRENEVANLFADVGRSGVLAFVEPVT